MHLGQSNNPGKSLMLLEKNMPSLSWYSSSCFSLLYSISPLGQEIIPIAIRLHSGFLPFSPPDAL